MSALIACETPSGCTCGAGTTTPRGMHCADCAIRRPAPTDREGEAGS